jgi:hypothetical protein
MECLPSKHEALSSNPSTAKRRRGEGGGREGRWKKGGREGGKKGECVV